MRPNISIGGNLTRDAEIKEVGEKGYFVKGAIATYIDQNQTDFWNFDVWVNKDYMNENARTYISQMQKGKEVYILQAGVVMNTWEDAEGNTKSSPVIRPRSIYDIRVASGSKKSSTVDDDAPF